uniref:Uncharacterized protein n=1 Tax=Arundo donax TaxID=35708 RepID=A0A0A9BG24_ARUDO
MVTQFDCVKVLAYIRQHPQFPFIWADESWHLVCMILHTYMNQGSSTI